jgi:hypothetical protein
MNSFLALMRLVFTKQRDERKIFLRTVSGDLQSHTSVDKCDDLLKISSELSQSRCVGTSLKPNILGSKSSTHPYMNTKEVCKT